MAPKRRKVVGSVVRTKTTKKVVKETVEVSLVETDNNSEPQLTQEEEENIHREGEEREEGEEERIEIELAGKTPTRVVAVQDTGAKLKPVEEAPEEKEPEYATPPEDVLEEQFPVEEDHEDAEKETEQAEHDGKEGKPAPPREQQVQPEEDEEETQDIAKEAEASMNEAAETPPEDDQEKQQEQVKISQTVNGQAKKEGKKRGRKRKVKRMETGEREGYKRYIHRVLKQVHPELGISSNAITVLDGFMKDMFERLASEADNLTKYTEKMTLSSREVQAAVRLVLPGELGKHAVVEGNKAVANYMAYDEGVAIAAGTTTTKKKKKRA